MMKKKGDPGLYDAIHAKRKRIAEGSGEKMNKPGTKGSPTKADFKQAAKTAMPVRGSRTAKNKSKK